MGRPLLPMALMMVTVVKSLGLATVSKSPNQKRKRRVN